ncbi:MAG: hypothetical protein H6835_15720 [Planctomycetes bacterium]|nr:hypothetical protein [Planctomycetota bacterium]
MVFAELVARARRRFRVQHWGRHAQIVDGVARALALDALPRRALPAVAVGVAVDVAPPAAPQRRAGTSPRAVSVNAAWRRSWAARARRASSRTPHGFGREPAHRVVTFGIDGPRLLPLTLFD